MTSTIITVVLLAIVGAIIAAVVGTIWYSEATPMGKIHMKYLGFDKLSEEEKKHKMQEAKPMMMKMYLAQMALSFMTAFAVVFIVIMNLRSGVPLAMAIGFVAMNWLCFVVPTIGSGVIWSNCNPKIAWKKFFSDIASNLVTILVTAIVASLFV
jgi:Na+/citrate or Na+/malate symporter